MDFRAGSIPGGDAWSEGASVTGERRMRRAADRCAALETAYREVLTAELRRCAGGVWGLFGQNEQVAGAPPRSDAVQALFDLADEIDAARRKLGAPEFELHARFLRMRGRQDENRPGEPRLAEQLLAELSGAP